MKRTTSTGAPKAGVITGSIGMLIVSLVAGFEGLRQTAYLDPIGIPTVCYGHTQDVKLGDNYTVSQCKALLLKDLEEYATGVQGCVHAEMPDTRFAALVSFAYNVGVKTACRSSVVKFINDGRTLEGCNRLLLYDRAAGIRLRGLTERRKKERELCVIGLKQ